MIARYFAEWAKVVVFTRRFYPLRRKIILANLCGGISSLLQLIVPIASIVIINQVLPNKNYALLIKISLMMGLAALGSLIATYFEFYFAFTFRERASLKLSLDMFEHIQSQPYLFFKNSESGQITSRITNDIGSALEMLAIMTGIGRTVAWLLSGVVLVPYFHFRLGLLILIIMPVYFMILLRFNRITKDSFVIVSDRTAVQSRELYESLSGIYDTKAYGAQKYRARRYAAASIGRARALIKARMIMTGGEQTSQIVAILVSLIVLTYGGAAVIAGSLTLGEMIGLNAVGAYLLVPINRLVHQSLQVQKSLASIERLEQINILEGEKDAWYRVDNKRANGIIQYSNVGYAYDVGSHVFSEVSFNIYPGEVILIAGPSGAGKTTLINLMMGYLKPTTGNIYLDGIDTKDLSLGYLRSQIAYVSQDIFLFSDSIRNNIRLGNLTASEDQILEAANLANALEFINRLPNKLDTQVGERGAKLSGGQRQRIAIARALIRDAPILILDEATSAVDQETEITFHLALSRLMKNRTTIIISHHADAFIGHVDRVFTLEEGMLKSRQSELERRSVIVRSSTIYQ